MPQFFYKSIVFSQPAAHLPVPVSNAEGWQMNMNDHVP
jgi:hypothetical protein